MDRQKSKSKEELIPKLPELQIENKRLKELLKESDLKIRKAEEFLIRQSERFAILNKYSIEIANQADESLSSFITNEFKSFFHVREVWLSTYDEKNSEMVLKATTLSEKDIAKVTQQVGINIIGFRTHVDAVHYDIMVEMRIGEPSSLHDISFGQIPVKIGSAIEELLGIGWFQSIALTDKGKLYGGLLVAGHKGQEELQKDELLTFTELTSNVLKRKLAESELAESEKRFKQFSDLLPELIYESDLTGKFTFINQYGLNRIGYTQEEFQTGLNFFNVVVPEEHEKVMARLKETFNGSETTSEEYHVVRKNGEIFPVFLKYALFTENGKPKGFRGSAVDITELRQAEEMLSIERNLIRTMIDNMPDWIYAKDTKSRYTICNKALAKQIGKSSMEEIIGKTDLDFWPLELASRDLANEQEIIRSGQPLINYEEPIGNASGTTSWSLSTKIPLYDNHGNIIGIIGIGKDITDRKLAEEEIKLKNELLQTINAEKDKFFSIIAHDLKGPLSAFLGATQILTEEIQNMTLEEIKEITVSMKESATNIYGLLENLLEWSRLKRGMMDFDPETFYVKQKIIASIEILTESARKKDITINYSIPEDLTIYADLHMFDAVIRNFVSNSIKFTPKSGEINISATMTLDNTVEIKISDTGIGMNKELIGKLFLLNEKTNRKGTEGEPSTGLGLLLCKEFIEKHNGKIRVESEERKGSTFSFTIGQFENLKMD